MPRDSAAWERFDLAALCDAIIRERGVVKACKALGLDRGIVWLYLAKHPEAQAAVWQARQETAHALWDECVQIADDSSLDPRDRHIRIDTRMRVAGKLNQRAYGDQPRSLTQTYVAGDVQLVADENTRRAMIEARERFLQRSSDIDRHAPAAPLASPGVVRPQPQLQAGTPIGQTQSPEDPQLAWMKSYEQSAENQPQAIVQPGATFTPYWEPHGVSEADLYG